MDWNRKNDDDDDDLKLCLSLQTKSTSTKSSLPLPFDVPMEQPLPSLNGIASQPSSAERPKNVLEIDVNVPTSMVADTELLPPPPPTLSSPDSTVTNIAGRKRSEREEDEPSNYSIDIEGRGNGESSSKRKLRLSKEQVEVLEETFKEQSTLSQIEKSELARKLNLQARQVEVWFQNRRARTKTKQTSIDCEVMRIQCASLIEENRRLKKELAELKAHSISVQTYMKMQPHATPNICPQCNNVNMPPKPLTTTSSNPPAGTESTWLINRLEDIDKESKEQ